MYGPVQPIHMSTLPGMIQMVTPLAKSTPDHSVISNPHNTWHIATCKGYIRTMSNEQARSNYLERQVRQMGSMTKGPSDMPSLEDGMTQGPESLQERVQNFCWENKIKWRQE